MTQVRTIFPNTTPEQYVRACAEFSLQSTAARQSKAWRSDADCSYDGQGHVAQIAWCTHLKRSLNEFGERLRNAAGVPNGLALRLREQHYIDTQAHRICIVLEEPARLKKRVRVPEVWGTLRRVGPDLERTTEVRVSIEGFPWPLSSLVNNATSRIVARSVEKAGEAMAAWLQENGHVVGQPDTKWPTCFGSTSVAPAASDSAFDSHSEGDSETSASPTTLSLLSETSLQSNQTEFFDALEYPEVLAVARHTERGERPDTPRDNEGGYSPRARLDTVKAERPRRRPWECWRPSPCRA